MDKAESIEQQALNLVSKHLPTDPRKGLERGIVELCKQHAEEAVEKERQKICGSKYSYVCQVESQQKEISHLKAQLEEAKGKIAVTAMALEKIVTLEQRLAEKEKEIERIKNNAIDLLGTQLCEKHQGEAKKSTFGEFQEKEKTCGCAWCSGDKIQDLEQRLAEKAKKEIERLKS